MTSDDAPDVLEITAVEATCLCVDAAPTEGD